MNIQTRQAYSEVDKFLELIGEEMKNKIPLRLRNFFKREMDNNYIPTINTHIPIKEQNLKRKTIAIISGLNLQYWCREERKQELLEIYSNNEKKYQKELCEKYNPDDIFKNRNRIIPEEIQTFEETRMTIVQEEKWYKKIFKLIKNLFHSNK